MACNENIVKNMANEVTRNCQAQNINVEPEFVMYLIELLLLNPKYGKLFAKTLDRDALAYFVGECGAMIAKGGTPLNTLKMQFIMRNNYDKLQVLIDRRLDQVETCLSPLLDEILDAEPDMEDILDLKKIFRKISIYIILSSGLGNPAIIMNLKEGMASLESVLTFEELKELLLLPRVERRENLDVLVHLVSGVRLFNRDCKKGGDMIPDLPFDLVDAGKACLTSLSNALMAVMQRVNTLTSAVEDRLVIDEDTGKVVVEEPPDMNLSVENYRQIFELLIFNRQYEIYIRRLLADAHTMVEHAKDLVEQYKRVLEELHGVVKYKTAVPVDTVFPLFIRLWKVWRAMQNTMYLVSTANRLMAILNGIQEHNKIPLSIVEKMLAGKTVQNDEVTLMMTDNEKIEKFPTNRREFNPGLWAMYLVSTADRLMAILNGIQEHNKIPLTIVERMLTGKTVQNDEVTLMMTDNEKIEKFLIDRRDLNPGLYLVSTANRLMAILNGIQEHNKIPLTVVERMLAGKTVQNDEVTLMMTDNEKIEKFPTNRREFNPGLWAMYLVSTADRLMAILNGIQEHNKIPLTIVERMLTGKTVQNDEVTLMMTDNEKIEKFPTNRREFNPGLWAMYLVSTADRLMAILNGIQEHNKIPLTIVERMLTGKTVQNDEVTLMMTDNEKIEKFPINRRELNPGL
ncbi:hypothetical protein NE865_06715 [Phthorimaea operculella]|nr:hypothetical protein NE865_06715 [Phthorimaea operculella]